MGVTGNGAERLARARSLSAEIAAAGHPLVWIGEALPGEARPHVGAQRVLRYAPELLREAGIYDEVQEHVARVAAAKLGEVHVCRSWSVRWVPMGELDEAAGDIEAARAVTESGMLLTSGVPEHARVALDELARDEADDGLLDVLDFYATGQQEPPEYVVEDTPEAHALLG